MDLLAKAVEALGLGDGTVAGAGVPDLEDVVLPPVAVVGGRRLGGLADLAVAPVAALVPERPLKLVAARVLCPAARVRLVPPRCVYALLRIATGVRAGYEGG